MKTNKNIVDNNILNKDNVKKNDDLISNRLASLETMVRDMRSMFKCDDSKYSTNRSRMSSNRTNKSINESDKSFTSDKGDKKVSFNNQIQEKEISDQKVKNNDKFQELRKEVILENNTNLTDKEKTFENKYKYMKIEYENYIEELNTLIRTKNQECTQFKKTIKDLFRDNSESQTELLKYKKELRELQNQFDNVKINDNNDNKVNELQNEIKNCKKYINELKSENDALRKQREQKDSYIQSLLEEKQFLYDEINELKRELRKNSDHKNLSRSSGNKTNSRYLVENDNKIENFNNRLVIMDRKEDILVEKEYNKLQNENVNKENNELLNKDDRKRKFLSKYNLNFDENK